MKIYLATWMEDNQGRTLTRAGNKKRLLSYFFLRQAKLISIKEYVINGKFSKP
jgi:hypothetical protein